MDLFVPFQIPKMNTLFACDLDNTLIHSYKKMKKSDLCMEHIHDTEQSFIGRKTFSLLSMIQEQCVFVPITTRSIEQYQRLRWLGQEPPFALVANGAVLLQNQEIDSRWMEETQSIIFESLEELNDLLSRYQSDQSLLRVRMVDGAYLFVYCKENAEKWANAHRSDTTLQIVVSGHKVYFLPREINKGTAAKRILQRLGYSNLICAGDSDMDIPMLNIADFSLYPKILTEKISGQCQKFICESGDLGEFALKNALQILTSTQGQ